jgi:hypothetical protein
MHAPPLIYCAARNDLCVTGYRAAKVVAMFLVKVAEGKLS